MTKLTTLKENTRFITNLVFFIYTKFWMWPINTIFWIAIVKIYSIVNGPLDLTLTQTGEPVLSNVIPSDGQSTTK